MCFAIFLRHRHSVCEQNRYSHFCNIFAKFENIFPGKIDSFSLSDAIETSLNMETEVLAELGSSRARGSVKRSCRTAALESGSCTASRQKTGHNHTQDYAKLCIPNNLFEYAEYAVFDDGVTISIFAGSGCLQTPGNSGQLVEELQPQNGLARFLSNCTKINDL